MKGGRRSVFGASAIVFLAFFGSASGSGSTDEKSEWVERFNRLGRFDPILIMPHGGIHGWTAGDGSLAYLLLYEATGERSYLEEFSRHADRLLRFRDSERGLPDNRGLFLPAWRHDASYLSNQTLLKNGAGEVTLSFMTPRDARWRHRASREKIFLRVEHADADRFHLRMILEEDAWNQHVIEQWENLTMDPSGRSEASGFYAPSRVGTSVGRVWIPHEGDLDDYYLYDTRLTGSPADRRPVMGDFPLAEGRYNRITNTGPMSFPLAYFARLVREDQELSRTHLAEKAEVYRSAAERAVAVHEDEWRENDEGEGWYAGRSVTPDATAGIDLPINRSNTLGLTMLELYRLTGNPLYLDRVTKLARAFKNAIEHVPDGDLYLWGYWLPGGKAWNSNEKQKAEDIGHAGVNVIFAYWCYMYQVVFDRTDMQRIANTWMTNVVRPDLTLAHLLDGQGSARGDIQWRFLFLGTVDSRVYEFGRRWFLEAAAETEKVSPHRQRLGWALLAWVASQAGN